MCSSQRGELPIRSWELKLVNTGWIVLLNRCTAAWDLVLNLLRAVDSQLKVYVFYLRYFSLFKAVQVIVQSRLGEKIHTKSKPTAMGQDWVRFKTW